MPRLIDLVNDSANNFAMLQRTKNSFKLLKNESIGLFIDFFHVLILIVLEIAFQNIQQNSSSWNLYCLA